ncbi:MAG TPA: hypothetical protein VM658_01440 [bacterium]|nr:hypothetical protein [bacterium]
MKREMKKVAAALAAVNMYMAGEAAAHEPGPPLLMSLWALSGRQEIMSARQAVAARLWK